MGVRVRGESLMVRRKGVHVADRAISGSVTCDTVNFTEKTMKDYAHLMVNLPMPYL
jgi:hypothetical protein